MPSDQHIVIVGAGHAGGSAAAALRTAGHKGGITLIGSERYPPYERPPLSKELLAGAIPHEKTYLRPETFYAETGIDLKLGTTVAAIDRKTQRLEFEGDGTLPYDALLITTGARARRLPLPGGGQHLNQLLEFQPRESDVVDPQDLVSGRQPCLG